MKRSSTKSRFSSNPSNSPNPPLPHTRTGSLGKAGSRTSGEGLSFTHVGHYPKGYTPSARGQPHTKQILTSTCIIKYTHAEQELYFKIRLSSGGGR